jgi:hypothetical protein
LQTIAEENRIPVIDFNGATQLGQSISFILWLILNINLVKN